MPIDAGKSAFEIAKEYDKTLTNENDWLASLKGEDGEGENAKTTKLYKAICVTNPYDPEIQECDASTGTITDKEN